MRNIMVISFSYFSLLVMFSLASSPSWAVPQDPKEVVETIIAKAKNLDNKKEFKQSSSTIESLVDFDLLTSEALGENYKTATTEQRTQIQELLKKILTRTIYPEAPKFFKNVKVNFTAQNADGSAAQRVHISSVVTKDSRRSTVEYWLAPRNGSYKIVDLAIEGERWVENVHDQFSELIEKKGVAGLISRMQKRASELARK